MKINWLGYYTPTDGYGRYNNYLATALRRAGVEVDAYHLGILEAPSWIQEQAGVDWDNLTVTCSAPYMVRSVPGRQWLYTMTEGNAVPPKWVANIRAAGVERVIVPCQHNKDAFERSGVNVPVDVVAGGTDPDDFPLLETPRPQGKPYTFLAFADRGERKGWYEVWDAFYLAFGGKTTGDMDVRLIVKHLPTSGSVADVMAQAQGADARIVFDKSESDSIYGVYAQADCVVIPSRSEGWGMIPRECAMMGLPVITQRYSGMDDGHTDQWAIVLEKGQMQPIPQQDVTGIGEWRVADIPELAQAMRACYDNPASAASLGRGSAAWLRANQTWSHAAAKLRRLLEEQTAREFELFTNAVGIRQEIQHGV